MSSSEYTALQSDEPTVVESTPAIATQVSEKPSSHLYQITIPENVRSGDTIYVEIEEARKYDVSSNAAAIGATVAGLCIGTIIAGPIIGILTAGAALYGTTRSDKVGDAVRGIGAGTCVCYNKTVETANKYHLADKVKDAATVTAHKASAINQEYKISERLTNFANSLVTKAKPVEQVTH